MYVAGNDGNGDLDQYARPGDSTFFGGTYPAQTWGAYMATATEGQPVRQFEQPAYVNSESAPQPSRTYQAPQPTQRPSSSQSSQPSRQPSDEPSSSEKPSGKPSASGSATQRPEPSASASKSSGNGDNAAGNNANRTGNRSATPGGGG